MAVQQEQDLTERVAELAIAVGALARRIRTQGNRHELSLTQRAVMGRLARYGPQTISDLARAEAMKSQSMGATVAALEELKLVEKQPHPTDGRQTNIVLTEKGAQVREENRAEKITWLAQEIAKLPEDEQEQLFGAIEILKRMGEC
ncbi:MAG TPA: MarR family transcriptional regulator [Fimbriimonadaceae bacterium]